jgi:hypothetical protein
MGTAMLGESGIEAAARRGRERIRREQEEQKARGNQQYSDPDTIHTQSNEFQSERIRDDVTPTVTSDPSNLVDQGIVDSRKNRKNRNVCKQSGGTRRKLSQFKKHLTG